jgi:hypothetical protein
VLDDSPPKPPTIQNIKDPCAGAYITVNTNEELVLHNPSFAANGGSDAAGTMTHKCDIKIVRVEGGVNSQVNFHLFTDVSVFASLPVQIISFSFSHLMFFLLQVPIPSRWRGGVLDDMLPQMNPKATMFLELIGVPHMPVGVRDFTGTKLTDVETDVSNNSTSFMNEHMLPSYSYSYSSCSIYSPRLGERLL